MNLILGYGNVLRKDDGLGVWLAELERPGWDSITSQQLLPEHAETISRAERAVFIDAALGEDPGAVRVVDVLPSEGDVTSALGAFTHTVTPASLLAAARALYGHAPPALLITVTGADFGHGEGFSDVVWQRLTDVEVQVEEEVARFAGDPPSLPWLAELQGALHA